MGKASTALSKRLHVYVSGGVQGVFFRSYTKVSSNATCEAAHLTLLMSISVI
jgi:hypothetical protein